MWQFRSFFNGQLIKRARGSSAMGARITRFVSRSITALSLAMMLVPAAFAQNDTSTITAVAVIAPPFVTRKGDQLTGFSVDLWNAVSAKMKVQTTYQIVPDIAGMLDAMRSKKADVVVTGAYYSTERDREFDFTFPILNAGQLVMVPETGGSGSPRVWRELVHLILSPMILVWLGICLILILIPAHVIWLLDRGNEDSISPGKGYFPGIYHAMIWAATALVSQVQQLPRQRLARVLALVWMFVGVVFIAFYTANLTADLTVEQIRGIINGPGDLPGKRVAALAGSLTVGYLKGMGADVQEFPTMEDMYAALEAKKVDAVVGHAPVLRYHVAHDGKGRVITVGEEFRKKDLAYIVQLNSPLRRRINSALVALQEDGTYDELYNKWFGGS